MKPIWKIKIKNRSYDYEKVYSYFIEKCGFCNITDNLYFNDVETVLAFIWAYEYRTNIKWRGDKIAKKRADERVQMLRDLDVFDNFSSKYRVYPCGDLEISEIRLNDLETVLKSPIILK